MKEKDNVYDHGLLYENFEDADYYPEGPDSDKDIKEKKDELDFTSYLKRTIEKKVKHVIMRQMNGFTLQTYQQSLHCLANVQHAEIL